nr:MAG TPA: protein of unknown function (DUF3387) [Caudoviricetes sp.]
MYCVNGLYIDSYILALFWGVVDWNLKESARAGMRRIVKRLLKKYNYPPEGQEDALNTIMEQCQMWSENS